MTDELTIDVLGVPRPQGSKKGFYNQKLGRVQIVDDNKKPLKDWRQDVRAAAREAIEAADWPVKLDAPVWLEVTFYFDRPSGHFGSGRNAGQLRASAPPFPSVKPDVDKLLRSTLDGLKEAGCYRDDARVVDVHTGKRYTDDVRPLAGARIVVAAMNVAPVESSPCSAGATTSSVQEALL